MTSSVHRALLVQEKGAPPTIGTRPTPKPGRDEVLVKNVTVALNPVDAYMGLMGAFMHSYPAAFGFDGAGIVEEVGDDVKNFVKGDRMYVGNIPSSSLLCVVADMTRTVKYVRGGFQGR